MARTLKANQHWLITGANGYVGRYLVEWLFELFPELTLTLVVRDRQACLRERERIKSLVDPDSDSITVCEYSEVATLQPIDNVIHLAGFAHTYGAPAAQYHASNVKLTVDLLEALRTHPVGKLVFLSSVKAAAVDLTDRDSLTEADLQHADPEQRYGISKRLAEQTIENVAGERSFHFANLRPALIYGPNPKGNLALLLSACRKSWLPAFPRYQNRRSMIHLEDVCRAIVAYLDGPTLSGTWELTDGEVYSISRIENAIRGAEKPGWSLPLGLFSLAAKVGDGLARITGRSMPFNGQAFAALFGDAWFDSSEFMERFDFQPEWTFERWVDVS